MLGDAILDDWRKRTKTGTARVRAYYDVIPDRSSELTLDATKKNEWGDPLPKLAFRDAPESVALREQTEDSIKTLFAEHGKGGQRHGSLRTIGRQFSGSSGRRMSHGKRRRRERRRLVGTRARSRESVRRRRADVRERELRERDAHVLRARASFGA